jgi:hypothetical protein
MFAGKTGSGSLCKITFEQRARIDIGQAASAGGTMADDEIG